MRLSRFPEFVRAAAPEDPTSAATYGASNVADRQSRIDTLSMKRCAARIVVVNAIIDLSARPFVDQGVITPRLGLGPEVVYMRGPGADRDLFVTGNVTYDVVSLRPRPLLVVPYVVVGGGFFRHTDRFRSGPFTSYEGAFTGGGGLRVWVSDRVYVAGEARVGWELHTRYTAQVGLRLGR